MAKAMMTGQNAVLYVTPSGGTETQIGFVSDWSFTENFQVQKAFVLGHFGPVSIDIQGYDCQIQINGFVPNATYGQTATDEYTGGSTEKNSIFSFVPTKAKFIKDDGSYVLDNLTLKTTGKVTLAQFNNIVVAESNMKASQSAYMTGGCTLWAIERVEKEN